MSSNKPIRVLAPSKDSGINVAAIAALTSQQVAEWRRQGIGEYYLDALGEAYHALLMKDLSPGAAARRLLVEVEDARRESHFDAFVPQLMERFRLSKEVARELIDDAKRRCHKNRKPTFEVAIAPIYAKVKNAGREAAMLRRGSLPSPLAHALLKSGIVA